MAIISAAEGATAYGQTDIDVNDIVKLWTALAPSNIMGQHLAGYHIP